MTAQKRFLLDSDVFIEFARNKGNPRVVQWISRILPRFRVLCPASG